MINGIGIIGAFLFLIKIFLHMYLKSKTSNPISVLSVGRFSPPELFIHYFDDAPHGYKWLKKTVNIIYAVALLCIGIFLIGVNSK